MHKAINKGVGKGGTGKLKAIEFWENQGNGKIAINMYKKGSNPSQIAKIVKRTPANVIQYLHKVGLYEQVGPGGSQLGAFRKAVTKHQIKDFVLAYKAERDKGITTSNLIKRFELNITNEQMRKLLRHYGNEGILYSNHKSKTLKFNHFWTKEKLNKIVYLRNIKHYTLAKIGKYFGSFTRENIEYVIYKFKLKIVNRSVTVRSKYTKRHIKLGGKPSFEKFKNYTYSAAYTIYAKFKHIIDPHHKRARYSWTIDHIYPCSRFYWYRRITWFDLVHPANLQMLSSLANSRKRDKPGITSRKLKAKIKKWEAQHGEFDAHKILGKCIFK